MLWPGGALGGGRDVAMTPAAVLDIAAPRFITACTDPLDFIVILNQLID
ncbi:MAG: hypothetical protein Q8Q62_14900 [Mesorhizobium sp.]|nr:hypothetical protein [Mesorhizobium sp.]